MSERLTVQQLRSGINQHLRQLYPEDQRDKRRGFFQNRPDNWDDNVPFFDPNNGKDDSNKRYTKDKLVAMYNYTQQGCWRWRAAETQVHYLSGEAVLHNGQRLGVRVHSATRNERQVSEDHEYSFHEKATIFRNRDESSNPTSSQRQHLIPSPVEEMELELNESDPDSTEASAFNHSLASHRPEVRDIRGLDGEAGINQPTDNVSITRVDSGGDLVMNDIIIGYSLEKMRQKEPPSVPPDKDEPMEVVFDYERWSELNE